MKHSLKLISTSLTASLLTVLVSVATAMPSFAADPFRSANPRAIGNETQKAFELMFKEGNYVAAVKQLDQAVRSEADDPLVFALRASTFYATEDYIGMQVANKRVRSNAEALRGKDPIRAYTYLAISDLIEAGYIIKTEGVSSAPKVLPLVQNVFDNIKKAQDCLGVTPNGFFNQETEDALKNKINKKSFTSSDMSAICAKSYGGGSFQI